MLGNIAGVNRTLTSETVLYGTDLTCRPPSQVLKTKSLSLTFDDGQGCVAQDLLPITDGDGQVASTTMLMLTRACSPQAVLSKHLMRLWWCGSWRRARPHQISLIHPMPRLCFVRRITIPSVSMPQYLFRHCRYRHWVRKSRFWKRIST